MPTHSYSTSFRFPILIVLRHLLKQRWTTSSQEPPELYNQIRSSVLNNDSPIDLCTHAQPNFKFPHLLHLTHTTRATFCSDYFDNQSLTFTSRDSLTKFTLAIQTITPFPVTCFAVIQPSPIAPLVPCVIRRLEEDVGSTCVCAGLIRYANLAGGLFSACERMGLRCMERRS